MDIRVLKETSKRHAPQSKKLRNVAMAFLSGGGMGILAQGLFEVYVQVFQMEKDMAISISVVSIIVLSAVLTGIGVFDKLAQYCGAGLFVPISGFANALTSCAMEGKSEGLIFGIGSNMFKLAGSVLTYGICAAVLFGMLRYLVMGG